MKIIVAGFGKTGTKSLNSALSELGYNVTDYLDHIQHFHNDWVKILETGTATVQDFKRMYNDVDVVMDTPVYIFWEEIHQAFPDAKIILTTRDENSWYKSKIGQTDSYNRNWSLRLASFITPTGRQYFSMDVRSSFICYGEISRSPLVNNTMNEMLSKHMFRQHYSYVLQKAPREKLLVYNIKEGWEPLCRFLGKDIPDMLFPHRNKSGSYYSDVLKHHPLMLRIYRELYFILGLLISLASLGCYKICTTFL